MIKLERVPLFFPDVPGQAEFSSYRWKPLEQFWLPHTYNDSRGEFGPHHAEDLACQEGTIIVSATTGRVKQVERQKVGGWVVSVETRLAASGRTAILYYAHMHGRGYVSVGDIVQPGDPLGVVGHTGYASGPHLHFAVWIESARGAGDHRNHPHDTFDQLVALSSRARGDWHYINETLEYRARTTPTAVKLWRTTRAER